MYKQKNTFLRPMRSAILPLTVAPNIAPNVNIEAKTEYYVRGRNIEQSQPKGEFSSETTGSSMTSQAHFSRVYNFQDYTIAVIRSQLKCRTFQNLNLRILGYMSPSCVWVRGHVLDTCLQYIQHKFSDYLQIIFRNVFKQEKS